MDNMNEVEVIERAIGIIHERGWCQHEEEDEDGRVCINRALGIVTPTYRVRARVRMRVGQAVGLDHPSALGAPLATWNDEPGRTVEDVVLALKHAAAGDRL